VLLPNRSDFHVPTITRVFFAVVITAWNLERSGQRKAAAVVKLLQTLRSSCQSIPHTHTHTHQPFVVTCAVCTASANAHPTPLSVDSRFKKIIICYRRQAFCLLVFCVAPAAYVCSGKKVCAKINCSFSSRLRVLKALGSKKSRCVLKQRAATD